MIAFSFKGWSAFRAKKNPQVIRSWLQTVGDQAQKVFTAGLLGAHSGQVYYRRNGTHRASAPGEYPANDSGNLLASMRQETSATEATIGTNVFYAKFLREGTRKMARRKMSDNAILEGAKRAKPASRGWVAWAKGK